jgi:hypothetical protein
MALLTAPTLGSLISGIALGVTVGATLIVGLLVLPAGSRLVTAEL